MGANAQTSVPTFTAAQVLTATQMNESARTGVPVFADSTARDAAFGGTGEKVLAEGQLAYLEDSNIVQYYDGSSWATLGPTSPGGLVRVGGGTLSGASTTFSTIFSATYDAYKIVLSNLSATAGAAVQMTLGATTTGYYYASSAALFTNANYSVQVGESNGAKWVVVGNLNSSTGGATIELVNPFLSVKTMFSADFVSTGGGAGGVVSGYLDNTTSYTAFTLAPASGNLTGTVNIYGYSLT